MFTFKLFFNIVLFIWVVSIPFKNAIYQISVVLLIVFFIFFLIRNKDFECLKFLLNKYKDLIIGLFLILFVMIISNIYNMTNFDSWKLVLSYIYRYGIIIFIFFYFYEKKILDEKKLFIFIIVSLFIQSADGIFQSIFGYDIFKQNIGNLYRGLTGATSNRNIFSFFMGLGALISILYYKKKYNFIFLILFCMFIFNTIFSYSRAIWVSLLFCFSILFIFNFKQIDKKKFIIIMAILIIIIITFINFNPLLGRINQLIALNSTNRTDIWISSLVFIKQNLIIGHGINSLQNYDIYKGFYSMHNQTLEILFDIGIVGLIFYLYILFIVLKELKYNSNFKLFCILLYFLINGNFGESIISSKTVLSTLTIFIFFVFVERLNNKKGILK